MALTSICADVLLDTFLDFISVAERNTFKQALAHSAQKTFPVSLQSELTSVLSSFGCRELPSPSTLGKLIEQVARYEFLTKPAASIALINSGVPSEHQPFWCSKTSRDLRAIYKHLTLSSTKVLSLLYFPLFISQAEARVGGYLRTLIGNMQSEDLQQFMRFVTGSSVCSSSEIKVDFNSLSGFARRPIAHTCSCNIELPSSYTNYDDFYQEFQSILSNAKDDFSWRMDAI